MATSMKNFLKEAKEMGFTDISLTNNGHYRLTGPGLPVVFCPQTPSDFRSIRNVRCQLRRTIRAVEAARAAEAGDG